MGFGDGVQALLETYSRCLSLLHSFGAQNREAASAKDLDGQSMLSRSLESDRAKVEGAYAARLSQTGRPLERGDAQSRSMLYRIVDRLAAAIARLLRGGRGKPNVDGLVLDYDALRALSRASRVDAVQAMDALSTRLDNTSRRSVGSQASGKSGRSGRSGRSDRSQSRKNHGKRERRGSDGLTRKEGPKRQPNQNKRSRPQNQNQHQHQHQNQNQHQNQKQSQNQSSDHHNSNHHNHHHTRKNQQTNDVLRPSRHSEMRHARPKRDHHISISTSNSADSESTKLGAIPAKLRKRCSGASEDEHGYYYRPYSWGPEDYSVPPVYPVRPFHVPEKSSKRGFWSRLR